VHASSAFSIARDRELEGGVAIPDFHTGRLTLGVGAAATHLAQERFYGQGGSSSLANETTFALDRRESGVRLIVSGKPWFRVAAGVGLAALSVANGAAVGVPGIFTRWTTEEVPTLNAAATYAIASLSVTADRRDVSGNPRRGGHYSIRLDRHADRSHNRYSFNRLNIDLEQHIPWWKNQRLLTLRGTAVFSQPDAGHRVPFYLEPTLGGSSLLRGFAPDRFRDRHLLALQAEYAYDIWPFLNAVLFYESGAVAHDWHQISLKDLKRDYGIGFRVGSARTVGVRTDVAFGSGEGTRITMRFSHAF
jgi:outer membrane protein assembly factor BamA